MDERHTGASGGKETTPGVYSVMFTAVLTALAVHCGAASVRPITHYKGFSDSKFTQRKKTSEAFYVISFVNNSFKKGRLVFSSRICVQLFIFFFDDEF